MPPPNRMQSLFQPGSEWARWIEASPWPEGLPPAQAAGREVVTKYEALLTQLAQDIVAQDTRIATLNREIGVLTLQKQAAQARKAATPVRDRKQVNGEIRALDAELRPRREELDLLTFTVASNRAKHGVIAEAAPALKARTEALDRFASLPKSPRPAPNGPLHVAPTGQNTHDTMPRYFRVLFWNLENFTRDARPRGSASIDAPRNQARLSAVAYLAWKLGADAVCMMETGTDVGTATTQLGRRLQAAQRQSHPDDKREWHPLVSPATHAIPEVDANYPVVKLGRPTSDRVLALRTLSTAFRITPRNLTAAVTRAQMEDACTILGRASPAMRGYEEVLPLDFDATAGRQVLHPEVTFTLGNGNTCPSVNWIWLLFGVATDIVGHAPATWWLQGIGDALQPFLRTGGAPMGPQQLGFVHDRLWEIYTKEMPAALAEGLELALLYILKAHQCVDGAAAALWNSDGDDVPSLPLLAMYCTTFSEVSLAAHDQDDGPLASAHDPGLILNAMRRVGIVKYNLETYGVLFRAPDAEAFFESLVLPDEDAATGDEFDGRGVYGIVQRDSGGQTLSVQEAGNVLGGRSALYIRLPLSRTERIPLLLLHNRFTGTADIKAMEDPTYDLGLTSEDKVIRARVLTLLEVARGVAGKDAQDRPLILGDFNFPLGVVDALATAPKNKTELRNDYMRRELSEGMASRGYFRRTKDVAQSRTSLVSYASIASGQPVYSQPYDAVYQPFDFKGGTAQVRSGTIPGIHTMFTPELLNDALTVAVPPQPSTEVDVDDDDEPAEDVAGMDTATTETEQVVAVQTAQTTFKAVLADEICRVYRSLARPVVTLLEKHGPWIADELMRRANTVNRSNPVGDRNMGQLARYQDLTALVAARATDLHAAILRAPFAPFTPNPLPLIEWIQMADSAVKSCVKRPTRTLQELPAKLDALARQLVHLETNVDARLWVGYRAVVSDHLPIIVEIDLQPD